MNAYLYLKTVCGRIRKTVIYLKYMMKIQAM